jgi:hypothetical protein
MNRALAGFCAAIAFQWAGGAAWGQTSDSAFGAPEQEQGMIAGICLSQLTIGEKPCACLAERAMSELDDEQRQYLIMTVVQPPAAERLPIARSQPDLAAIATFIETARTECAETPAGEPSGGEAPVGSGEAPAQ